MSAKEYLRAEGKSPVKREYVGGFPYAQAAASKKHTLIGGNIVGALYQDASQKGCRLYHNGMKLVIEGGTSLFYPGVMLVCELDKSSTCAESATCLLVNVVSDSIASCNRLSKYGIYTAIPSLQTYLIVELKECRVYAYTRPGEKWHLDDLTGKGKTELPRLRLDGIYAGVRYR